MAREGGSYVRDENGVPVLRERTDAVVTTAKPKKGKTTKEVTNNEDA